MKNWTGEWARTHSRIKATAQLLPVPIQGAEADAWAADIVTGSVGAVNSGRNVPWYKCAEPRIVAEEGGKAELMASISGLAVTFLLNDPSLSVDDACFKAGNEYLAGIRSQWDDRAGYNTGKSSIESMEKRVKSLDDDGDTQSMVAMFTGQVAYQPQDMPEKVEDPRLPEVMEAIKGLSDNEQTALDLYSGGMGYEAIANDMGLAGRQVAYKIINRASRKVREVVPA